MPSVGFYDYIYVSDSFRVYGRSSTVDYGASEEHGQLLSRGASLEVAIMMANWWKADKKPAYGIKYSENLEVPVVVETKWEPPELKDCMTPEEIEDFMSNYQITDANHGWYPGVF